MPIATDAWMFFIPLIIAAAALLFAGFKVVGIVVIGLSLFILYFFRDPERQIPPDPLAVVSPADGTVYRIDHDYKDETTGEEKLRISIFLSIFNVHINRFPVSGKIEKKELRTGKFMNAMNHLASEENTQVILTISTEHGIVVVKQIVGLIARRIVSNAEEGGTAVKGERYGLMRFGSRMDVILPKTAKAAVKLKDKVEGGSSVVAYFK